MTLLQHREVTETLNRRLARASRSRLRRSVLAVGLCLATIAGVATLVAYRAPIDRAIAGPAKPYVHAASAPVKCQPRPTGLQQELSAIAAGFDGKVGIAISQAGCGWIVGERTGEYFPQQSVSKLWVALSVLDAVDRGQLALAQPMTLRAEDQVVFNQPLRWKVLELGGLTLPVQTLMQDALSLSDNMANDKLLWQVGGPRRVRAVLAERKLGGIRFGPGERLLQSQIAGVTWTPDLATGYNFERARDRLPLDQRAALLARYVADPLDGATPAAIAQAMARLGRGELLSAQSTAVLLDIMAHSKSGPLRLKGGLAPGWKAYHKTGTGQELRGVQTGFNDVAMIEAPDGTQYGVAVMIGETRLPNPARLGMMQAVTRALIASHEQAHRS